MSNLLNIKDQSGNWIPIPVVTNGIKSITQNQDYTLTITLNDGTTYTTTSIKGEDGQDYVLTEQDKQEIAGLVDTPVDDVQINGTSIINQGVAEIPIGTTSDYGVLRIGSGLMLTNDDKRVYIARASDSLVKSGTNAYAPIVPSNQHSSTFYGLAKASGDTTQSQSDNPVGTYTDEAKASIKNMLGVEDVDIDSKAPVITETATGSIVSFDDGADDMPLQSLVVDIDPVQDLHGYDSPWPGGGGKNLFGVKSRIDMTQSHLTFTSDADYIIVNGTKYGQTTFVLTQAPTLLKAGTYYFKAFTSGASTGVVYVDVYDVNNTRLIQNIHGSERPYTFTEDTEIYVGIRVNDNNVLTNYTIGVVMSASSGITEFTPYENICPISGWEGMEIQHTGKNLFDGVIESGDYNVTPSVGGVKRAAADRMRCANFIPVKPNTTYYSKMPYSNSVVVFYDEKKWMRSNGGYAVARNTTFTTPSWCKYITFYFNGTEYNNDISINYPATDTDYHPYTGRSITIDLGQTVYGGYVDVMTGKLTLTYYFCTPDNAKKIAYGIDAQSNLPYAYFTLVQNGSATALSSRTLCSMYKAGAASGIDKTLRMWTSEADIWDSDLDVTSLDTVKAYFADLVIVYPLATPIEIQLDAHTIKTLLGTNNIFADTGDVSVTYRADSELYINKQIPDVPVEDVQINGTSILQDGVANIPVGGNDLGVVKENLAYGIDITGQGQLLLITPSDIELKKGYAGTRRAIMTLNQHIAAFYGLAKAAGADEKDSTLPVGQYTESAQTAIKNMLGVIDGGGTISETITGTDPTITAQNNFRYMCGELYTLNFTPCVSGVCEVIFTSGATPTVLTLPDTVRMPAWWTGVEANTTYEISIVDGVYGAVMSWS